MSSKPDAVDFIKGLCEAGIAIGVIVALGEALSGKRKGEGVGLALVSFLGRVCCSPFDTPKCTSCDNRTTFDSTLRSYFCSVCGLTA